MRTENWGGKIARIVNITTTKKKNGTIVVQHDDDVIGWINADGCENASCLVAVREGRKFHAIPRGFAVTLPDYHFTTLSDAVNALSAVWSGPSSVNPPRVKTSRKRGTR